jgi:hypothetical protein
MAALSDRQAPPWLPDWRNTTGYPEPKVPVGTSSSHRWRWEFQRRDPDYQCEWAGRANRSAEFWRERYGLIKPVDPASPKASFVAWPIYWIQPRGAGDLSFEIRQRAGTALIQFDLKRPLGPQFESAQFILQPWTLDEADEQAQEQSGFLLICKRGGKGFQWRPKDWLRYLRLLDAQASGAPKLEILAAFYPNISNEYPEYEQNTHLKNDLRAVRKLLRYRQYTLF